MHSLMRLARRSDDVCPCFTILGMRTAKTVSITLPPDLLVKAQEAALREHRTMSELFREALEYGRAKGRELGIASEEDVERLTDEYRASKRA